MIGAVAAEFLERAAGPAFTLGLFALFTLESVAPLRIGRTERLAHAGRNLLWVTAALVTNALVASLLVTTATSYAGRHRWGLLPTLGLEGAAADALSLVFPRRVDRSMRWVLVSPILHQDHHSRESTEANSNFGSVFTFADRLFGTLRVVESKDLRFGDAHPRRVRPTG